MVCTIANRVVLTVQDKQRDNLMKDLRIDMSHILLDEELNTVEQNNIYLDNKYYYNYSYRSKIFQYIKRIKN